MATNLVEESVRFVADYLEFKQLMRERQLLTLEQILTLIVYMEWLDRRVDNQ